MAASDYVDAVEAAEILEISASAVCALARRGTMPSEWIGGARCWKREVVERLKRDAGYQKRSRRGAGERAA